MTRIRTALAIAGVLVGGAAFAKPAVDVSAKKHPHLHMAQQACEKAFQAATKAQEANEFDMEGHAAKAKDLLQQAAEELKQAAGAANANAK